MRTTGWSIAPGRYGRKSYLIGYVPSTLTPARDDVIWSAQMKKSKQRMKNSNQRLKDKLRYRGGLAQAAQHCRLVWHMLPTKAKLSSHYMLVARNICPAWASQNHKRNEKKRKERNNQDWKSFTTQWSVLCIVNCVTFSREGCQQIWGIWPFEERYPNNIRCMAWMSCHVCKHLSR